MKLTAEEIEAARTEKGGFTRATLKAWGVPWPPPRGWKKTLIEGRPAEVENRSPDSIEAKLLREVVMAVIGAGQGDILKGIDALNEYYGSALPTVADVIGGRPKHAIVRGDISFDDKVYSFRCARMVR